MTTLTDTRHMPRRPPWGWLIPGFVAWVVAYASLIPFAMRYGVMSTPGVVIDGKVVHAGGVPARGKVESWF